MARLYADWGHSFSGLAIAWRREEAFRLEIFLFIASFPAAAMLASSVAQGSLMVGSLLPLIFVEVPNSAIEAAIDRVGSGWQEMSRVAKDLGSAEVLLTSLFPIGVWPTLVAARLNLIVL